MYKVNQKTIKCIIGCFGLGMPLLFAFVLPWLSPYRMASVILLFIAWFFNNRYPDRIALVDGQLMIKLYLVNDWLTYPLEEITIRQEKSYISIGVSKKLVYRVGMEGLSLRFYEEIKPYLIKSL